MVGTWRSHGVFNENQFLRVPSEIPKEYAATISVNPCTAYRLLADFAKLQSGSPFGFWQESHTSRRRNNTKWFK
jgi:NADPH:quinone reductase-like Zn-dependent oxidoreductase